MLWGEFKRWETQTISSSLKTKDGCVLDPSILARIVPSEAGVSGTHGEPTVTGTIHPITSMGPFVELAVPLASLPLHI